MIRTGVLTLFITFSLSGASLASLTSTDNQIPGFSPSDFSAWDEESFVGNTQYNPLQTAGTEFILEAISDKSASGLLFRKRLKISSDTTLSWRWKISSVAPQLNEQEKTGDDYPARIYVVVSDGPFFWQTRTLVYVWSNNQPVNQRWHNAYTKNAMMWAINSGDLKLNQWQNHHRKIQQDLFTAFGKKYSEIEAIALMTDSDNSGVRFKSWYSDIFLK